MKLSIKLALAMSLLVALVVVAAMLSTGAYLRREVGRQLVEDLDRTSDLLQEVQLLRLERLSSENRVVADEPRLKAVVNSAEIDEQTVRDTAMEMREVSRSDLFLLLGPDGAVRANVAADGKAGPAPPPGAADAVIEAERQRKEYTAAWALEGDLYLVAGHVVTLSGRIAGVLITGDRIDDRIARKIRRETATDLALITRDRITAAALGEHLQEQRDELARAVLAEAPRHGTQSFHIMVGGEQYIAQAARVVGLNGGGGGAAARKPGPGGAPPAAFFVMLRSLDEAMATYRQIRSELVRLGVGALLIAVLAAALLASTLTRRVAGLANATALVAQGDLDIAVPIGGRDEIGALGRAFNDMVAKLRISREELRTKERLERELEIATVIQTLLLPAQPQLDGFDVAARMVPAEEVGGDFYDLHQTPWGSWVAVGDVSGHGVTSGLVMMMVQSMLAALARRGHDGAARNESPREVLRVINAALYENLRVRMRDDDYMTMVLFKHVGGGRFRYAGAHEKILVYRRATGAVEVLETDGTWLGMQEDIGPFLEEREVELQPGDAMLLYTDGVTEARNPQGGQYNLDRLAEALRRQGAVPRPSAEKIRDGVIEDVMTWSRARQDDITVLVLRRLDAHGYGAGPGLGETAP